MNYIVFDIETYSPSNLDRIDTKEFKATVIGAFVSWLNNGQGEYLAFFEKDVKVFLDLLWQCDLVIGYNHLWFDLPVLQKYSDRDLMALPSYDIMIEVEKKIGFKLKLDDLCKANFNEDVKTDTFMTYRHYHTQGKWVELVDYCMNDVRLTNQLFQMILNKKDLNYYDLHILKQISLDEPVAGKVEIQDATESIF
jgi:RNase_H superfamily